MGFEFPKDEHYSNSKLTLDKNFLKSLCNIREESKKVSDQIFSIQKQCSVLFNPNEVNNKFRDIKANFNENLKTVFSNSDKIYPENTFKKELRIGQCEACKKRGGLEKVHIIKKSSFKRPYTHWSFLRYHPANILFLCHDCHDKLEYRLRNKKGELVILKKTQFNRMRKNMNSRIKKIKSAMNSDQKSLKNYKKMIDHFKSEKKKILDKLVRSLQ